SPCASALLKNIEAPGIEVTFMFRNVRDDVMEATRNEQQPFVYGSLSRRAIYLVGPPSSENPPSATHANAPPAATDATLPTAPAPSLLVIDPSLVGIWDIMVPSDRGPSR